jgi:hypothetical protein
MPQRDRRYRDGEKAARRGKLAFSLGPWGCKDEGAKIAAQSVTGRVESNSGPGESNHCETNEECCPLTRRRNSTPNDVFLFSLPPSIEVRGKFWGQATPVHIPIASGAFPDVPY